MAGRPHVIARSHAPLVESDTTPAVVSFIIPVRNDAARLARCLESIRGAESRVDVEVIVVDHESTDGSAAVARDLGARVLTTPAANVAALRNQGASMARGSLLAFVDADHEIAGDWVTAALAAMERPDVAAAGAPYFPPRQATWVQRAYDGLRRHPDRIEATDWLGAGNMIVRRSVFEALGGFDERLEACEDVDLCFRVKAGRHEVLSVPGMHSVHAGDPPTLRRLFKSELWRGRDNLRVSLGRSWTWQSAASAAIPAAQLIAIVLAPLAALSRTRAGFAVAAMLVAMVVGTMALRAWKVRSNSRGAVPLVDAIAVAAVYDAARALALIARAGHHGDAPARTRRS